MTLSLGAIFLAGVFTLVTPCILPMLPVYFTLLLGEGVDSVKSGRNRFALVTTTLWFVVGFGVVFVAFGLAASAAGAALATHRTLLLALSGALITVFGAKQLGLIRIGWLDRTLQLRAAESKHRWLNGLLFGFAFALGWTPCVGPILGSVLTFAAARSTTAWQGGVMLAAYASGIGLPLVVVALAADRMLPMARSLQRFLPRFEKLTGAAMVVVGAVLMLPAASDWARTGTEPGSAQTASADEASLGGPSERPRFVEFYSSNCPTCEKMAPLLKQLRQDCEAQGVDIVQFDLSEPKYQSMAEDFRVHAVPAFQLFETSGETAATAYGEHTLPELRALASQLIDAPCVGVRAGAAPAPREPKAGCAVGPKKSAAEDAGDRDAEGLVLECGQES